MKSVLLSVRPMWCRAIASGEKTLEIRKNKPNLETPFKCYIYCTGDPTGWKNFGHKTTREFLSSCGAGKVIGEFTCDSIIRFDVPYPAFQSQLDHKIIEESLCSYYMLHRYAYHNDLYGWRISQLTIYDEPSKLKEFGIKRPPQSWCYTDI